MKRYNNGPYLYSKENIYIERSETAETYIQNSIHSLSVRVTVVYIFEDTIFR